MEFWGIEVKPGQSLEVDVEDDYVIHLSQAAVGEFKGEKNEFIPIFVKANKQRLVLGTLNLHNIPQMALDLVFDSKFEISHTWKSGSVFFTGYKSPIPDEEDDLHDSDSEDVPLAALQNGPKGKSEDPQPSTAKAITAKKVNVVDPKKDEDEDDGEEDEDDEDDSDDSASDEEMADGSDDEDDDVDGEDEESKKPEPVKKRATDSATKTPVPSKKAKVTTPQQKTDAKKGVGVHVDTPHPSKKASKTPTTSDKSATPKATGGEFFCKECNRGFKDKIAISSHNKAKHDVKA